MGFLFFDFLIILTIPYWLPTSSGGREVYPLTFSSYEKNQHRTSILEASLIRHSVLHYEEACCEATALRPTKKNPLKFKSGDFSIGRLCPNFSIEVGYSISHILQKSKLFQKTQKSPRMNGRKFCTIQFS